MEGIREVIETLSKDFVMVINSSSSEVRIENYLKKNDLLKYFDKIYGVESSKSKEEKFELILKNFDITNKECVLITDTLGDVLEAKTLGISSIVVLWGYQEKKHFNLLDTEIILLEKPHELVPAITDHFKLTA
jgi:HAD superfamily hydrolase (TIGR01509 family)